MIYITKFIAAEQETTFRVPRVAVALAARLLPRPAFEALADKGICLAALAAAVRRGERYLRSTTLTERGIEKTVVIQTFGDAQVGDIATEPVR